MKLLFFILFASTAIAYGRLRGFGRRPGHHSGEVSTGGDYSFDDTMHKCSVPVFDEMMMKWTRFPSGPTQEMHGYDPAVYEPILNDFWTRKEGTDLGTALDEVIRSMATHITDDRYRCKGTQFNQLLIYIMEKQSNNFMGTETSQLMDKLQKMLGHLKGQFSGIPHEILIMINTTLHRDAVGYIEKQEFGDASCFLQNVKEQLKGWVEGGDTLDVVKTKFGEYARDYDDVFTCTDPASILPLYSDAWNVLTKARRENIVFDHLKHGLEKIFENFSTDKMWMVRWWIVKKLVTVVHDFVIQVIQPLRPVIDFTTKAEMVEFLGHYLSEQEMDFAIKLIDSLGIFTVDTPSIPDATTLSPETAPGGTNLSVQRRRYYNQREFERLLNLLLE